MNPYEVLAISNDATPRDIVQAAALALRERKYSAREIADARKKLMDPEARMILDFVHHVDIELLLKPAEKDDSTDTMTRVTGGHESLERLTIFDSPP